jgi:hypothetical protein
VEIAIETSLLVVRRGAHDTNALCARRSSLTAATRTTNRSQRRNHHDEQ